MFLYAYYKLPATPDVFAVSERFRRVSWSAKLKLKSKHKNFTFANTILTHLFLNSVLFRKIIQIVLLNKMEIL